MFSLHINNRKNHKIEVSGRERGIRTPGGMTLNGFQDRRIQPGSAISRTVKKLEVTPGFEPGIRALQARALPLGYATAFQMFPQVVPETGLEPVQ